MGFDGAKPGRRTEVAPPRLADRLLAGLGYRIAVSVLLATCGLIGIRLLAPSATAMGEAAEELPAEQRLRALLVEHTRFEHRLRIQDPQRDVLLLSSADAPPRSTLFEVSETTAVFVASDEAGGRDVYRVEASAAPNGTPVRLGTPRRLTHTDEVDERLLTAEGTRVAFSLFANGRHDSVVVLDLAGQDPAHTADWEHSSRLLDGLRNWQHLGGPLGMERTQYLFAFPPADLEIAFLDERTLNLSGPGIGALVVDLTGPDETLPGQLTARHLEKIEESAIHVAVDLVRDLSFIGPDKMAVVQRIAFDWIDAARRQRQALLGATDEPPEVIPPSAPPARIEGALGLVPGEAERRGVVPPPPIAPFRNDAVAGEGEWLPVTDTVTPAVDGVPVLFQASVRVDPERDWVRVHAMAWDPGRLALGISAGLEEPVPRTTDLGTGRIPRDDDRVLRLVGAFNGGFQTVHGTFGMQENGTLLVGPRQDAATVVTTDDGRIGIGRWSHGRRVPRHVVGMRQNLSPLVEDGVADPDERSRWGWALGQTAGNPGSPLTLRTGLCRFESGALGYFAGNDIDGETLGRTMVHAGCDFGIHLDMNPGHTGFEFYDVTEDRRRGYRSRLLLPDHRLTRHPRYIRQSARDFFYLYHREIEPPPAHRDPCGGAPNVWRRLTADSGELAPEHEAQLLPPAVQTITERSVCGDREQATTIIRLPLDAARGQVDYFREPSNPELPIAIPVVTTETPDALGFDSDGRLQLEGRSGRGVPALRLVDGMDAPTDPGSILAIGSDGWLYLLFSTSPPALTASLAQLPADSAWWLPRDQAAPPRVRFDEGTVRAVGGERLDDGVVGLVLSLQFAPPPVAPEQWALSLDELFEVEAQPRNDSSSANSGNTSANDSPR